MAYKCTRWLLNRQLGTNRLNWNLRLEQNEKVLLHLCCRKKLNCLDACLGVKKLVAIG